MKKQESPGFSRGEQVNASTLLVAIALLSTHPQQPKGREIADRLLRVLQALPTTEPTEPTEGA